MSTGQTIIFQAGKLGDIPAILAELTWAEQLLQNGVQARRVYGVSGGVFAALAYSLAAAAQVDPARWGRAAAAPTDFRAYLNRARTRDIRRFALNPITGIHHLGPLQRWLRARLQTYCGQDNLSLGQFPIPLYLCAMDSEGTFTPFGAPDPELCFQYQWVQVGPPQDALVLDAFTAALSTVLSTRPWQVNGAWYRDLRPAIPDGGAIVADMEAANPAPILRQKPYAQIRPWKVNWITSSFIMHSQNERNQPILASYYLDLLERQRAAQRAAGPETANQARPAVIRHIDLPYVGSTEAATNMRQSVEHKAELIEKFRVLLNGQAEGFPFDQPANIIYGAGGFSGILAGLVATRAIDRGFDAGGGQIRQIYGVSAGVLNGFFHAVQLAAARRPDLYRPPALNALADLENFIASVTPGKLVSLNRRPRDFWQGWSNLGPLEDFLRSRLQAYTGSTVPEQLTFDDIQLPLTVAAARGDGYTDFLGMTGTGRRMHFAGREITILPAPIIKAVQAGWSMNTYIQPTALNGQLYRDGGGTFYDIGLFVACLDEQLTNMINIHLDEPEGHRYNIPARPHLVRVLFDTHNYYFPEERRRMRMLTDLLYEHALTRTRIPGSLLPPDFRRNWKLQEYPE